uniref:Yippee domain-containing protein n=1 Tax=Caenorhabditis japonica TaxID=281687 RepID=A0A8R1HPV5_CAEJA
MGLKFVENSGGKKMYYCANCYTYLADKATVESTNFTGLTGQAYLFSRVVNARFGPIVRREMMTGLHFIRDAFCLQCKQLLGWMYELAPNDTERYKEGSVILERLRILETEGITNNTQLEARVRRPFDMAYEVANRMRHGRIRPLPQPAQNDRAYRLNDIFRFRDGEHLPVIQIFDEDHIAQTFGYNQRQIAGLRHTVDNLNDAIFQCARGNNADLWVLGFRADIGAQFIAIREETAMQARSTATLSFFGRPKFFVII